MAEMSEPVTRFRQKQETVTLKSTPLRVSLHARLLGSDPGVQGLRHQLCQRENRPFRRYRFLPIGKRQRRGEALFGGPYLVVVAIGEEPLPCGVFQEAPLGGEGELGQEVGSRGRLGLGLKGKVAGLRSRSQGVALSGRSGEADSRRTRTGCPRGEGPAETHQVSGLRRRQRRVSPWSPSKRHARYLSPDTSLVPNTCH